jgi:hypothetical protein
MFLESVARENARSLEHAVVAWVTRREGDRRRQRRRDRRALRRLAFMETQFALSDSDTEAYREIGIVTWDILLGDGDYTREHARELLAMPTIDRDILEFNLLQANAFIRFRRVAEQIKLTMLIVAASDHEPGQG